MEKTTTKIFTSFHIDKSEIAIDVGFVQEVVNFPEQIIPMPLAPDFLVGIFNLRGTIIPVINLKSLLKYSTTEISNLQKIAIVETQGAKVGLLFDSTSEILRVSSKDISDFDYVAEGSHRVICGAIKLDNGARILQILDTNVLINIENIPQILDQQKLTKKNLKIDIRHKCISFCVKNLKMAFEISKIHEIVKVPEISNSSFQNASILGIMNLRGLTIPVVSFAKILKITKEDEEENLICSDKRIIILKLERALVGLVVDSVECINSYYKDDVMAVPLLSKERVAMFQGCIKIQDEKEIFLLSHDHIFSNQEIIGVTAGHSKIYQMSEDEKISKKSVNRESYISFRLDHLFGISIKDIREIINYSDEILSAPGMPEYVKGMLNLRSQLITIIDTRCLYKMDLKDSLDSEAKVLIFENDSEKFGLIVDSLESILTIDHGKKFKVPSIATSTIQNQFQDDIKEIVSVPMGEKEGALIILNVNSVSDRIKSLKSA